MGSIRATFDFLRRRKQSYQLALTGPAGQDVLRDLAKFCRANESAFDPDPRIHAALEGRREVWLRIQAHLNLTPAQLYELFAGRTFNPQAMDKEDETNA